MLGQPDIAPAASSGSLRQPMRKLKSHNSHLLGSIACGVWLRRLPAPTPQRPHAPRAHSLALTCKHARSLARARARTRR